MSRTPEAPRPLLGAALGERIVIADGAVGSMLQRSAATLEDFDGHEGCNEILNSTRPDIVRSIHGDYLDAGVDCVSTNTFGASWGNLGEYGISERIFELAQAGAQIARQAAGRWSRVDRPRWVLGSIGQGTKLLLGWWGLKPARGPGGRWHEELAGAEGRPRLRMWLERAQTEGLLRAAVVHGYFPCVSEGNDLVVLDEAGSEPDRIGVTLSAEFPLSPEQSTDAVIVHPEAKCLST